MARSSRRPTTRLPSSFSVRLSPALVCATTDACCSAHGVLCCDRTCFDGPHLPRNAQLQMDVSGARSASLRRDARTDEMTVQGRLGGQVLGTSLAALACALKAARRARARVSRHHGPRCLARRRASQPVAGLCAGDDGDTRDDVGWPRRSSCRNAHDGARDLGGLALVE